MADEKRLAAVAARFDVGAVLESGPNWTFCRATERAEGRPVTLRIVEDDRLAQDANAQRFLTEARQVRAIEHPSLIPLLDAGAAHGIAWTASATTTGTPVQGKLSPEDAARLGEQIASALDAVHAKGVIHRDLRAAQVVQMAPGSFRVGGFGVGRWMMAGAVRTDGTPVAGLPGVLSPELVTGGAATVAADVHALGALLYELVTGQHPFAGDATADQLERLAKSYALRPSALAPELSPALEEVILRALAKDPASRYVTALAMAQACAVCPGGSGAPTATPVRRRTMPTWAEMLSASRGFAARAKQAALIITPLLIIAGATAMFLRDRAPAPREDLAQRARRETAAAPRDAGLRIQFGEELERQGRTDDAKRMFDEALAIDPKITGAFTGLARLEDRVGKREDARRTLRRAIDADPKAWQAVLALARMLKQDGRIHESRVVLQQGLMASPDQPDLKDALFGNPAGR